MNLSEGRQCPRPSRASGFRGRVSKLKRFDWPPLPSWLKPRGRGDNCWPHAELGLSEFVKRLLKALFLMTLFSGADSRLVAEIRSLDGQWDFRCEANYNGTESPGAIGQSEEGWTKILVPGSFDQAEGNSLTYCGEAYYRTRFAVSLSTGQRVFVHFGVVVIRAKVWVNGILVGQHLYPYASFAFDFINSLQPGINTLLILADNRLLEDAIPDSKATGHDPNVLRRRKRS
jgi:Glycosyl hydrolases family 2, sugar binding domain